MAPSGASVRWGPNTVHTIRSPAPSAAAPSTGFNFGAPSPSPATGFGAPSPAPGGLFGSTSPAPSTGFGAFGAPSPAPGGFGSPSPAPGGLFASSSPAPSTGFSGFGAPSPAPGGLFGSSGFGSTPASSGLFGSAAPAGGGLFGAPAPSPFGAPVQQQQQQIPAQAAMQAHMDASARQEEQRVTTALQRIQMAYQGLESATDQHSAHFTSIVYNPATPQMRQQQWLHGYGVNGRLQPIAPPRPVQISERDWTQAVVRNPDCLNFMPIPLVGADALMARATGHKEQVDTCVQQLASVQGTLDWTTLRHERVSAQLSLVKRKQTELRKRLLALMRKVEITRSMNLPTQPDEIAAMSRLVELAKLVEQLRQSLSALNDKARQLPMRPVEVSAMPDRQQLMKILTEHRTGLTQLTMAVQRDMKDLELIEKRVTSTARVSAPSHASMS